jgi:hypothetical protein
MTSIALHPVRFVTRPSRRSRQSLWAWLLAPLPPGDEVGRRAVVAGIMASRPFV